MRLEQQVQVTNAEGLHARPATQLTTLANQFEAEITIWQGEKSANANSVLGLMMLESQQGKDLKIVCEGEDAQAAMQAVTDLINTGFGTAE